MAARRSKGERDELWRLVQYLNLAEMKDCCARFELPMHICVETADGRIRRTSDRDRKDVVLQRIFDFATKGVRSGPTVYRSAVVSDGPLPVGMGARTRVRYGQYEKHNPEFVATMKCLTGGRFRTGMIARLVLRDFWTAGKAPTMKQFAVAWIAATEAHRRPRPEGAYLVDRWKGEAGPEWKSLRKQRASEAIRRLDTSARQSPAEP